MVAVGTAVVALCVGSVLPWAGDGNGGWRTGVSLLSGDADALVLLVGLAGLPLALAGLAAGSRRAAVAGTVAGAAMAVVLLRYGSQLSGETTRWFGEDSQGRPWETETTSSLGVGFALTLAAVTAVALAGLVTACLRPAGRRVTPR